MDKKACFINYSSKLWKDFLGGISGVYLIMIILHLSHTTGKYKLILSKDQVYNSFTEEKLRLLTKTIYTGTDCRIFY